MNFKESFSQYYPPCLVRCCFPMPINPDRYFCATTTLNGHYFQFEIVRHHDKDGYTFLTCELLAIENHMTDAGSVEFVDATMHWNVPHLEWGERNYRRPIWTERLNTLTDSAKKDFEKAMDSILLAYLDHCDLAKLPE